MKKETLTEKLIKRTYGISGPLDEHKRREADRIGNQVFIVLFYLMTFGNLIPFVLAYKYPQIVAIGYPLVVFGISMMAALYVVSQTKKTGITAIDPEMLSKKESKQLHFPGLKAGLIKTYFKNDTGSVLFWTDDANCCLSSHSKGQERPRRRLGGSL